MIRLDYLLDYNENYPSQEALTTLPISRYNYCSSNSFMIHHDAYLTSGFRCQVTLVIVFRAWRLTINLLVVLETHNHFLTILTIILPWYLFISFNLCFLKLETTTNLRVHNLYYIGAKLHLSSYVNLWMLRFKLSSVSILQILTKGITKLN